MKKNITITLLFLLFLPHFIQAETLKEVVRGTLTTNPEILSLRINTKAYRLYVDEEEGKLYPSIDYEAFFEDMTTKVGSSETPKSGTNQQILLEQTLFDGWLTNSKIDEAEHNYKATKIKNVAAIEGVVLDAITAYLNVVKNEELTLLSDNNLLIHDDYLQVAIEAENVSGDTLDRMQVESKIFSANAKFSDIKRDAIESRVTLEKIYGKEVTSGFCRPVVNASEFNNLEKVIAKALTTNYTILEEMQQINTQRSIVSQEKSRFFPKIKAKLIHEVDDGVDSKDVKKTEDSFRLTLNYNIFSGYQDKAILQREKLFFKESQKRLDSVVKTVIEEVKINHTSLHTAKKRINYLKNYLDKNKDILIVYLEQFEGGTRSFIDILNHEAELFRAKKDLINEQFIYTTSYYNLLNLVSNLSSTVLSSERQVCEEIKVDVERRKLSGEDETQDEDLAALFEEENLLPDDEPKEDKDAKVKSLLNKILSEIYNPNAVNKNITVSNIVYNEKSDSFENKSEKEQAEDIEELIKIKQELEEQAIREENKQLSDQIRNEAEKISNELMQKESEKVIAEEVTTDKENKIEESKSSKDETVTPQENKESNENKQKIKEPTSKENKTIEPKSEADDSKIEGVTPDNKEEKEKLSLKEKQAASRELAQMYQEQFREKMGLDERGYSKEYKEKILKQTLEIAQKEKEKVLKEAKEEQEKEQAAIEKEHQINLEKEKAKKIREAALQNAQVIKEKQLELTRSETVVEKKNQIKSVVKQKERETENQSIEIEKNETRKVIDTNASKIANVLKDEKGSQEKTPLITNGLKEEFYSTKSKRYTLAILTLSVNREPSFIQKHYDLDEDIVIYKLKNDGKTYFKVIYGVYDSAKEAKADIKNLHKTLRKNGVIVNRISTHQKLFKKYNPKSLNKKSSLNLEKEKVKKVKYEAKSVVQKKVKTNISNDIKEVKFEKKGVEKSPLIKNSLKRELLDSKSKKYTLGLLTLSVHQKPDFIKKYYNLEKNIIVYKSQNNGQTYFKVIYGVYDSAKEAKADIKNLHKTLQKNGVFVNRISTHHKLFRKYNPNGEDK